MLRNDSDDDSSADAFQLTCPSDLHGSFAQPADRLVMTGSAPFEFRLRRETPFSEAALKAQCNKDWRDIIYE
jgi:hypothetical protein